MAKTDLTKAPYSGNKANLKGLRDKEIKSAWWKYVSSRYQWIDAATLKTPVTVRTWTRGGSVVYAAVWITTKDGESYGIGYGSAGGYGYHKESAAVQAAFEAAGVEFHAPFDGAGDAAVQHAIEAVARAAGWRGRGRVV